MIIMMIMVQDNKELLIRDLCGRLQHGVMLKHISTEKPFKLFSIKRNEYASYKKDGVELAVNGIYYDWCVNDIYHDIELYVKPYLFPLSSMTEEQSVEYRNLCERYCPASIYSMEMIYWYNKNHFDYIGLIPMGMALDATGLNIY